MPNILITGSNGQVGKELQILASQFPQFNFHFTTRQELDITKIKAVKAFLGIHNFDYCINCAAYTNVDKAESEREQAFDVNASGIANLAIAAKKNNVQLIHLSTDYVYHNAINQPIKETDITKPQSIYALSKLEGEQKAQSIHSDVLIIRTSWVYSSFGHNFVKTMLRLGKERDLLKVVYDQIGTPTYARDLALTILTMIAKMMKDEIPSPYRKGIYHFSNEGITSWYDFAKAIFDIRNIDCKVLPIETKDYPTPASRPSFSLLNKSKLKSNFKLEIPHWRDSLKKCLVLIN